MTSLTDMHKHLSQLQVLQAAHVERLRVESDKAAQLAQDVAEWEQACVEIQTISQAVQQVVFGRIETIVTHALQYVFGQDYALRVHLEEKRGSVEVSFLVVHNGIEMDPLSSCGGGVVDVVSFALRLASIVMHPSRNARRLLLLDEPFKFLSAQYRPAAAELLQDLATELNFQLIIVTHDPEFAIGEVIQIGQTETAG